MGSGDDEIDEADDADLETGDLDNADDGGEAADDDEEAADDDDEGAKVVFVFFFLSLFSLASRREWPWPSQLCRFLQTYFEWI